MVFYVFQTVMSSKNMLTLNESLSSDEVVGGGRDGEMAKQWMSPNSTSQLCVVSQSFRFFWHTYL